MEEIRDRPEMTEQNRQTIEVGQELEKKLWPVVRPILDETVADQMERGQLTLEAVIDWLNQMAEHWLQVALKCREEVGYGKPLSSRAKRAELAEARYLKKHLIYCYAAHLLEVTCVTVKDKDKPISQKEIEDLVHVGTE